MKLPVYIASAAAALALVLVAPAVAMPMVDSGPAATAAPPTSAPTVPAPPNTPGTPGAPVPPPVASVPAPPPPAAPTPTHDQFAAIQAAYNTDVAALPVLGAAWRATYDAGQPDPALYKPFRGTYVHCVDQWAQYLRMSNSSLDSHGAFPFPDLPTLLSIDGCNNGFWPFIP